MNIVLAFISALATIVMLVVGLSVWRIREYVKSEVDRQVDQLFLDLQQKKLQPALDDAQAQLANLSTQGTRVILTESHILLDEVFRFSQETYRRQLELEESTDEEIGTLLQDRVRVFCASKEVTLYLLASLSRDPVVVEDMCQKLVALAGHEAVRSRADFILEHMRSLMSSWPPGSSTRMEIRSLIDEIERYKRNDAGQ